MQVFDLIHIRPSFCRYQLFMLLFISHLGRLDFLWSYLFPRGKLILIVPVFANKWFKGHLVQINNIEIRFAFKSYSFFARYPSERIGMKVHCFGP
jgi:hypothetical protein